MPHLYSASGLVAYTASTPSGDATRPNFILDQMNNASLRFNPNTGVGTCLAL